MRFFHTLKYNLVFWFFFSRVFFLSYKMKYQWQQQNFDPHRLSTIVSSSSYILSNIFKKPPEFLVWGEEKRKTKVTVFKEGRGNIFFIEWDFLCWRYNQIFSFILLDHLKNRKKQKLEMRFFFFGFLKDNFWYTLGQKSDF